jgi:ABC-type dipeptide/oligopeptide/nickel transport system permease component
MGKYLLKTLLMTIPTFLGVLTIVFFLIHLTPGDPAMSILGPNATAEAIRDLRKSLGLDQPLYLQYLDYLGRVAKGDLGRSLATEQPVLLETLRPFPYTIHLALAGVLVALIVGIPIGVISAVRRNTLLDYIARATSISGISIPVFFLAIIFLWIFSYQLRWFPVIGVGNTSSWRSLLHHLILPGMTLGISLGVLIMRVTRSCMLEVLGQDYVRTARAKGLGENAVIMVHALKNTLLPIVTVVGLYIGQLLGGAILTETVFARQGVGKLLMDAIFDRDYPQVQGTILIFACAVILVNVIVDIIYRFLDPRIKL